MIEKLQPPPLIVVLDLLASQRMGAMRYESTTAKKETLLDSARCSLIGATERHVMRLAGAALVAVVALYFADAAFNDGRFFDGLVRMARSIESGYH
jgi:hypothetical protein